MLKYALIGAVIAAATPALAQNSFGDQPQQQQPGYQQQPNYQQQPQSDYQQAQPRPPMDMDQLMQMERQDYGVRVPSGLHSGQMHGPTPASIPGGQVVTTKGLAGLMKGGQAPYILFDVLGGQETLPGAKPAVQYSQGGTFSDQVSQQMAQQLQQATQGRKDVALVFYCASPQCWMSYNASLRAINLGYSNVLWYRGGMEAWKAAGLPTQGGMDQYQQSQPGPQGPQYQQPQPYQQGPQHQPYQQGQMPQNGGQQQEEDY